MKATTSATSPLRTPPANTYEKGESSSQKKERKDSQLQLQGIAKQSQENQVEKPKDQRYLSLLPLESTLYTIYEDEDNSEHNSSLEHNSTTDSPVSKKAESKNTQKSYFKKFTKAIYASQQPIRSTFKKILACGYSKPKITSSPILQITHSDITQVSVSKPLSQEKSNKIIDTPACSPSSSVDSLDEEPDNTEKGDIVHSDNKKGKMIAAPFYSNEENSDSESSITGSRFLFNSHFEVGETSSNPASSNLSHPQQDSHSVINNQSIPAPLFEKKCSMKKTLPKEKINPYTNSLSMPVTSEIEEVNIQNEDSSTSRRENRTTLLDLFNENKSNLSKEENKEIADPLTPYPTSLKEKLESINLKKIKEIKKISPQFYAYATRTINQAKSGEISNNNIEKLDIDHLPLLIKSENKTKPNLNLKYFKNQESVLSEITVKQHEADQKNKSSSFRIIYPPFNNEPRHNITLDIYLQPQKKPSIIAFESTEIKIYKNRLKKEAPKNFPNMNLRVLDINTNSSEYDHTMFALHHALKAYSHYTEFTSKIHSGEEVKIPEEFYKHSQNIDKSELEYNNNVDISSYVTKDKSGINSETLKDRRMRYAAKRKEGTYSTSIEGFRLKEIKRAIDFLVEKN